MVCMVYCSNTAVYIGLFESSAYIGLCGQSTFKPAGTRLVFFHCSGSVPVCVFVCVHTCSVCVVYVSVCCVCTCTCSYVSAPRLFITSDVMWCHMNPI